MDILEKLSAGEKRLGAASGGPAEKAGVLRYHGLQREQRAGRGKRIPCKAGLRGKHRKAGCREACGKIREFNAGHTYENRIAS
jgi:hypothetical protein